MTAKGTAKTAAGGTSIVANGVGTLLEARVSTTLSNSSVEKNDATTHCRGIRSLSRKAAVRSRCGRSLLPCCICSFASHQSLSSAAHEAKSDEHLCSQANSMETPRALYIIYIYIGNWG